MENFPGNEEIGTLISSLEEKKPCLWENVLTWASSHPPRYPWRRTEDPYRVLIGELLLEKAKTSPLTASARFLRSFPTVQDLLAADEAMLDDVLEEVHLQRHRDAIISLVSGLALDGGGRLPCDSETLARLTGLERYHVRAVFCFGYGLPLAVVDGHVRRLLRRLLTRSLPRNPSNGLVDTIAESLVPYRDPQTYNGVLLDLAELVCRAEEPWCQVCPLFPVCDTAPDRAADKLPVPISKHTLVKTG